MPPYAYPIKIKRTRQTVCFDETREIEENSLTLAALAFVGEDAFSVHEGEYSGYRVVVGRVRLETDDEMNARIAREESYMAEYNRRQAKA